tara:strand:+ start:629 stop:931 length:303 start_codon:yes stop_codon:yes gene_type:complete
MNKVRKTKELDHYLKNIINKVPDKIENFIKDKDGEFSMTYYEGNWSKDVYDNFTEIQAGKIFKRMEQFRDKAKFVQKKLTPFIDAEGTEWSGYEYKVARY